MSDCRDCTKSAAGMWHGFQAACKGCAARAVSRGPNYYEARTTGKQTWKYREELRLLGVTHDDVKAAATVDAIRKEAA